MWVEKKTVMKGSGGKIMVQLVKVDPFEAAVEEPATKAIAIPSTPLFIRARELQDSGVSKEEIAKRLEKDVLWVDESLLIARRLPAKVHKAIEGNKFSRCLALQLLMVEPKKLEAIIDAALVLAESEGKL